MAFSHLFDILLRLADAPFYCTISVAVCGSQLKENEKVRQDIGHREKSTSNVPACTSFRSVLIRSGLERTNRLEQSH